MTKRNISIVVTGGRDYTDRNFVFDVLDTLQAERTISLLGHGGARGADFLAGMWAQSRNIQVREWLADWNKHGLAAGPMRNSIMLREANPDLVVAFPGGKGTANCVAQARKMGIEVMEVRI